MKYIVISFFSLMFLKSFNAQNTLIPDVNFEQALINLGYDVGPTDGMVPTANIDTITSLSVFLSGINDLSGIEDFTALTYLNCSENNIMTLNITQNTALTSLDCYLNQLTNLNLTQNLNLTDLRCNSNQLTSLILTQNIHLVYLKCNHNQLTNLNLNLNSSLTDLICNNNSLTCLNIKNGNNLNVTNFFVTNNPNLSCIEVDNVSYSTTNWTNIDTGMSFSTNCGNPCAVGINELKSSPLSIYPNPANEVLYFSTAIENIKIYNVLGKELISYSNPLNFVSTIGLTEGIYFLKSGNETIKFIVKH